MVKAQSEKLREKIIHQANLVLKKIKPSCSRELSNQEGRLLLLNYKLNSTITPETESKIEALHDRLKRLSKRQMEVLKLVFWEGKSKTQVATSLHLSSRQIYNIIHEAFEVIRH